MLAKLIQITSGVGVMTEDRLKRYTRERQLESLKRLIAEEEEQGATAEDLKDLRALQLTLTLSETSNKILQQAKEQYIEERGAEADAKTLDLFDYVLSLRN